MLSEDILVNQIHAAVGSDPRINLRSFSLQVGLKDNSLLLDGELENIAAKRLVVGLAKKTTGIEQVIDMLRVIPVEPKDDHQLLNSYTQLVLAQIDLKNCTLTRVNKGKAELLHEVRSDDRSGEITFSAADGVIELDGHVISLSHRRIAEVMAWWVSGCRNVNNGLVVTPPEEDSDDEITDAVHLALEMDPFPIHADQIGVLTKSGCVALQGIISSESEKKRVEFDAWCIPGVANVENNLAVGR